MPATAATLTYFETLRWVPGQKAASLVQSIEASEQAGRDTVAHYQRIGGYKMQLWGYDAQGNSMLLTSC